ncbi:hypothetical protein Aple_078680 [Acrocarpospora pleiomorpha]|uniref:Uncharacterized protein n=1 Tax=Acrocarpospora pleiomorpha TaxID=90975 RepID=A0A5M3XYE2_9ACTN|nr:hypothetical protein Aple_078680 [Acrocarpospora pleiomorpha]
MIGAMEHFIRPSGSPPVNGYSHAVAFTGATVAVSGQVPVDGDGNLEIWSVKRTLRPRSGRFTSI